MHILTKKGFTLAEVLITLAIIGVVAVLTIPTLISNTQKSQYVSGLKKELSVVQQAIMQYIANQGGGDFSQTDVMALDGSSAYEASTVRQAAMEDLAKKYFNVTKICNVGDTSCNYQENYINGVADPFVWWQNNPGVNESLVLFSTDGASIAFYPDAESLCIGANECIDIGIDVNGLKPPNTYGRDMFFFSVDNKGTLYPQFGTKAHQYDSSNQYWRDETTRCGDPSTNSLSGTVYGSGCAARVIESGWQMDY